MRYEIITSVNSELWRQYAQRSMKTWQRDPIVYWEADRTTLDPVWERWRGAARPRETSRLAHQCVRFSHKVQAQIEHTRSSTADYVIWLDADVVQLQEISDQQLQDLMPAESELFTFLDRQPTKYAETGWIAYNMHHPRQKEFVNRLEDMYLTGEIFSIPEWHDAYVWDYVRQRGRYPGRSLLTKTRTSDPFGESELAPWFQHHKGQRKRDIK